MPQIYFCQSCRDRGCERCKGLAPSVERVDIETLIAWQIGEAKNARVHENDHTIRRRDEVLAALREVESLRREREELRRYRTAIELAVKHLGKFCQNDFRSARKGEFVAAVYSVAEEALKGSDKIPRLLIDAAITGETG